MNKTLNLYNINQSLVLWFTYLLHILVIPAFIGALINFFKYKQYSRMTTGNKSAALNKLSAHHQWLMRTFITMVVLFMASIGTAFYGFGYAVAVIALTWWIYRMCRGLYSLASNRQLPLELQ